MPGQRHSQPTLTSFGLRLYACSGVTFHPHFWPNDRGLLPATAVTRGLERTPNKSQHTMQTLEKENSPAALAEIRTRNPSITSPALLPTNYPGSPLGTASIFTLGAGMFTLHSANSFLKISIVSCENVRSTPRDQGRMDKIDLL